jgi:hypothetical protein
LKSDTVNPDSLKDKVQLSPKVYPHTSVLLSHLENASGKREQIALMAQRFFYPFSLPIFDNHFHYLYSYFSDVWTIETLQFIEKQVPRLLIMQKFLTVKGDIEETWFFLL